MKTLLILRHAKSSWKYPELSDHDRPLKRRGRRDAPRMGQMLDHEDLVPDQIISSTAVRARLTAELVVENCGYEGEIEFTRDLYHADPFDQINVLRDLSDEIQVAMLVGHNPGLELLLEALTGEEEWLPTGALVQVTLPIQSWQDLTDETEGELVNLWRPRDVQF